MNDCVYPGAYKSNSFFTLSVMIQVESEMRLANSNREVK